MITITEDGSYEGHALTITWNTSPTPPPRAPITQASRLCFTGDGMIVLVTGEDDKPQDDHSQGTLATMLSFCVPRR